MFSMSRLSDFTRIREVMSLGLEIADVDGSYLYRKQQHLMSEGVETIPLTIIPITGWEVVSANNFSEKNIL